LAFALPIVQKIEEEIDNDVNASETLFALILSPTRELAQQIQKHLRAITKYTSVTTACIIGGLSTQKQERILNAKPNIVIGTTGRLWEFYQNGNEHLQKIPAVKFLVVDETDRMIERGHFSELENILKLLNGAPNSRAQTFVFSATLTLTHQLPSYVKQKKRKVFSLNETTSERTDVLINFFKMRNPKIFDITNQHTVTKNVVGE
jgi:ATP-dependent RNA helicase DDX24/MAK5